MNSFLFSGSSNSTIVCWNTENCEMIRHYDGNARIVVSVAVFYGGLFSAALRTEILKWNINTGQFTRKFAVVHGNNMTKNI
jgi:WD40 repeat protein